MKQNKKNKRKDIEETNAPYLQTNPDTNEMPGTKNPRQNPRNLPTENTSMHEDLSNDILSEADRKAHDENDR